MMSVNKEITTMKILDIVKAYREGTLSRDIDEKGSQGFWDYAGEIAKTANGDIVEVLQEDIYNALLEVYEASV